MLAAIARRAPKRGIFILAFCCCLGIILYKPGEVSCREAGWVPLENNKAANLKVSPVPVRKASKKNASVQTPASKSPQNSQKRPGLTVYDNQPPVTEGELNAFVDILPRFRTWAKKNGETAHPVVTNDGKPDFLYSSKAGQWVQEHNFNAPRFFCIMGRMAAGLVIVEEGNDFKGTRPADMPAVSQQELGLVRRHLAELLTAGGTPAPLNSE